MPDRQRHWDDAYRTRGIEGVSWYQPEPLMSLELIRLLEVQPSDGVIDIGGGASFLVDRLVESGFSDVNVLDVSEVALEECRRRLNGPSQVTFMQEDVLEWSPSRRFDLWHDRAVLHFLTDERDRRGYLSTMLDALNPGGAVVIGTFAEDGPTQCSGLDVARYSETGLSELLGPEFTVVTTRREIHNTPGGAVQPFSWVAARLTRSPD